MVLSPSPPRPSFTVPRPTGRDWARFEHRLHQLLLTAGILPSPTPGMGNRSTRLERRDDVSVRIRRVQEYVEGHLEDVRALDELAEVAGLSRYHFARRFRDEVGEPPWAFVRRVRSERAHALLSEGHAPAEVAHETGFADQAHLTRTLRTRYGRTPGQIRRMAGEEGESASDHGRADRTADRKDVQDPTALPV